MAQHKSSSSRYFLEPHSTGKDEYESQHTRKRKEALVLEKFQIKSLDLTNLPNIETDKVTGVKTRFYKSKSLQDWTSRKQSSLLSKRSEILNSEMAGVVDSACHLTQKDILCHADAVSATKSFDLDLKQFGPYRCNYSRNGRHLLIGSRKGHIATFDWLTKKLGSEFNCMQQINDVQWLHNELMFAVAQRNWLNIYDNQGVELHCIKHMHKPLRLTFLPFHFLLVGGNQASYLQWLDVSVGKMVATFPVREGPLNILCSNPANAIVCLGHAKGTVSMWSPNVKEPLVKLLCHPTPLRSVSVEQSGTYMATTGMDSRLRIWDIRTYRPLKDFKLGNALSGAVWSQRGLLAASIGPSVHVIENVVSSAVDANVTLQHECHRQMITDMEFCPFEDVLGLAHTAGFSSILVPGAGEPNLDAFEANPFQTKRQRQEAEVKGLLDKIQPEMISLDSGAVTRVDDDTLQQKLDERSKFLFLKPSEIQMSKKKSKKGKGVAGIKKSKEKDKKRQQAIRNDLFVQKIQEHSKQVPSRDAASASGADLDGNDVLDRFVKKKRRE